jgi:hypothetical protein
MMRLAVAACGALLLLIAAAGPVNAQIVRGSVRERASNAGLIGTVVELLRQDATGGEQRVTSALTVAGGTFALSAPVAGRFVLAVKRIGYRRHRSEPFELATGETLVREIVVDLVPFVLSEVVVTGTRFCAGDPREGDRVAALWDEARTALFATQISLRDRLFRARVTHYVRELDPKSRRILSETRSHATGVVSRPFASIPAESLSARGYWIPGKDGASTYYGPDADVLLSQAFLDDHCFSEVPAGRDRRGLVGLGFAPVAGRTVPDIVGTLWLDEKSFELRFVEFTYSQVRLGSDSAAVGGELHFAKLPSGAWLVRRWFLRLPVLARLSSPVATEETTSPWVLVRPVTLRYREEGGDVTAEVERAKPARRPEPNDRPAPPR